MKMKFCPFTGIKITKCYDCGIYDSTGDDTKNYLCPLLDEYSIQIQKSSDFSGFGEFMEKIMEKLSKED